MLGFLRSLLGLVPHQSRATGLISELQEVAQQDLETAQLVGVPESQVYESAIQVAGTHVRTNDVLRFHDSSGQRLILEAEPSNYHDENAIRVCGHCRSGKLLLGYVPAYLAKHIAEKKMLRVLQARLSSIRVTENREHASVRFDLLGPADRYAEFYPPSKPRRTRKTKPHVRT